MRDVKEFQERFNRYKNGESVKKIYNYVIPYEDREYNYYRANQLGYTPDNTGHMPSRDYETGMYLKRPTHPTIMKSIVSDLGEGYIPTYNKKDGQIYSHRFPDDLPKYAPGKNPWDDSVDFITRYEGWSDTAYQKKGDVPTIGYGTTNPKWVSKGKITRDQGRLAMAEDLATGEPLLRKNIKDYDKLPDTAKTVLRDILYNVGQGNLFNKSPKFMAAINSGNYMEAARQMDWDNNKPGMGGAKIRNAARQKLFLQDLGLATPSVPEQRITPVITRPDALQVKQVIPEQQTRATWTGAEKISPYVTGRPMLKLKPTIKLPNLIDLVEDSEWEPTLGFKNGKLPGYEDGTVSDDEYDNVVLPTYEKAKKFVEDYRNSEGFKQRFLSTAWRKGFSQSKYDPDYTGEYKTQGHVWNFGQLRIDNYPQYMGYLNNAAYFPDGKVEYGSFTFPSKDNEGQISGYDYGDVFSHELGHALDSSINIQKSIRTKNGIKPIGISKATYSESIPMLRQNKLYQQAVNKIKKALGDQNAQDLEKTPKIFANDRINHNASPIESYADLIQLRYFLQEKGIYDSMKKNNPFTEEHLKQYKKLGKKHRIFRNFSDNNVIWMMNNIASTNNKKLSPRQAQV